MHRWKLYHYQEKRTGLCAHKHAFFSLNMKKTVVSVIDVNCWGPRAPYKHIRQMLWTVTYTCVSINLL
jgi:hypothetical protein